MLQQRARESLARLKKAEQAKDGVSEAAELDKLQVDFMRAAKPVRDACVKASVMTNAGISIALPANITKHQQAITNVSARFGEKPESATLKQGRRWKTLLDAVEEMGRTLDASLETSWQTYISSNLFVGRSPEEEERLLARTPANRQAIQDYRGLYLEFAELRSSPPTTPDRVTRLQQLSKDLANIRFQRNVPRSVRDFLDAASTPGGAALDLLTEEVNTWLSENHLLGSYVIRPKMR